MRIAPAPTNYRNPIEAFLRLKVDRGADWKSSSRSESHAHAWPAGMEPAKSKVFAHNEIVVPLPPEKVFAALTDAKQWPTYYPNAKDVKLPRGKDRLEAGMEFTWSTFGTTQKTTVKEFEPGRVLAWEADSPGTRAYHRWILEPVPGGTRIITEETQRGPTAALDHAVMNPALHAGHQQWLEGAQAFGHAVFRLVRTLTDRVADEFEATESVWLLRSRTS